MIFHFNFALKIGVDSTKILLYQSQESMQVQNIFHCQHQKLIYHNLSKKTFLLFENENKFIVKQLVHANISRLNLYLTLFEIYNYKINKQRLSYNSFYFGRQLNNNGTGYIIRAYYKNTLKQRDQFCIKDIYLMIKSVQELHKNDLYHGHICLENFVLNDLEQLYLIDHQFHHYIDYTGNGNETFPSKQDDLQCLFKTLIQYCQCDDNDQLQSQLMQKLNDEKLVQFILDLKDVENPIKLENINIEELFNDIPMIFRYQEYLSNDIQKNAEILLKFYQFDKQNINKETINLYFNLCISIIQTKKVIDKITQNKILNIIYELIDDIDEKNINSTKIIFISNIIYQLNKIVKRQLKSQYFLIVVIILYHFYNYSLDKIQDTIILFQQKQTQKINKIQLQYQQKADYYDVQLLINLINILQENELIDMFFQQQLLYTDQNSIFQQQFQWIKECNHLDIQLLLIQGLQKKQWKEQSQNLFLQIFNQGKFLNIQYFYLLLKCDSVTSAVKYQIIKQFFQNNKEQYIRFIIQLNEQNDTYKQEIEQIFQNKLKQTFEDYVNQQFSQVKIQEKNNQKIYIIQCQEQDIISIFIQKIKLVNSINIAKIDYKILDKSLHIQILVYPLIDYILTDLYQFWQYYKNFTKFINYLSNQTESILVQQESFSPLNIKYTEQSLFNFTDLDQQNLVIPKDIVINSKFYNKNYTQYGQQASEYIFSINFMDYLQQQINFLSNQSSQSEMQKTQYQRFFQLQQSELYQISLLNENLNIKTYQYFTKINFEQKILNCIQYKNYIIILKKDKTLAVYKLVNDINQCSTDTINTLLTTKQLKLLIIEQDAQSKIQPINSLSINKINLCYQQKQLQLLISNQYPDIQKIEVLKNGEIVAYFQNSTIIFRYNYDYISKKKLIQSFDSQNVVQNGLISIKQNQNILNIQLQLYDMQIIQNKQITTQDYDISDITMNFIVKYLQEKQVNILNPKPLEILFYKKIQYSKIIKITNNIYYACDNSNQYILDRYQNIIKQNQLKDRITNLYYYDGSIFGLQNNQYISLLDIQNLQFVKIIQIQTQTDPLDLQVFQLSQQQLKLFNWQSNQDICYALLYPNQMILINNSTKLFELQIPPQDLLKQQLYCEEFSIFTTILGHLIIISNTNNDYQCYVDFVKQGFQYKDSIIKILEYQKSVQMNIKQSLNIYYNEQEENIRIIYENGSVYSYQLDYIRYLLQQ